MCVCACVWGGVVLAFSFRSVRVFIYNDILGRLIFGIFFKEIF